MSTLTSAVGHRVSAWVRSHSTLAHPDYVDHISLQTPIATQAPPERWARAMFGDAPGPFARLVWQGLLRLELQPGRSADTVAGLRITERSERWIRLEGRSSLLTCHLVIHADHGQLSLATFMQYRRGLGRAVWEPLSAVHRRLTPPLLRRTEQTMRAETGSAPSPGSAQR